MQKKATVFLYTKNKTTPAHYSDPHIITTAKLCKPIFQFSPLFNITCVIFLQKNNKKKHASSFTPAFYKLSFYYTSKILNIHKLYILPNYTNTVHSETTTNPLHSSGNTTNKLQWKHRTKLDLQVSLFI